MLGSPLICQSLNSAGVGTFPALWGLPRYQRAEPSTALDELFSYITGVLLKTLALF
jgi:hypothetical protein